MHDVRQTKRIRPATQGLVFRSLSLALLLSVCASARANHVVTPGTLRFGQHASGTSTPLAVTLTNTSKAAAQVVNITSSSAAFVYSGPTLPVTLSQSQSLMGTVTFSPTAIQGYTGKLTFTFSAGATVTETLTGTGTKAVVVTPPVTPPVVPPVPVVVAPAISSQPASQTVTAGQSATFSVAATGTAPMTYSWNQNGAAIGGATSSSYTIAATTTANSGTTFSVTVSNAAGSATSNSASLTVNAPVVAPTITTQPAPQTVTPGQTATFSVAAMGTAPLTYAWSKNGLAISGANASSYTTPAAASTDAGALFTVAVSNAAGTATSSPATLTVSSSSCQQSAASGWTNSSISTQTTAFTATFDATPSVSLTDGVVGFSSGAATDYTSLAAIARFNPSGMIDVRNGANYAADVAIPYLAGVSYHFRMVIDPTKHTYMVYVTVPGAAEVALATNYAFRGEQAALSSFNNWALDDDQGSLAVCNMTITTNPPVNSSCTTTSGVGVWSNTSVAVEQASFSATYDATPVQAAMDGSVGFSSGAATGYTSLATITRFNPSGFIDVRNGANYAAAVSVPYTAGTSYHFRMSINPATQTYSVYVTPPGQSEITLAANYAFRSEQAALTSVSNWAMEADAGSLGVCNMTVTPSATGSTPPPTTPPPTPTAPVTPPPVTTPPVTISLGASPSSMSLGSVMVGSSNSAQITVTNSGNTAASISNVSVSGAGMNPSGLTTGQVIGAGQSATMNVTFAPAGTGTVSGSVTITSNAANSPLTIGVSGSGAQVPVSHSATLVWSPSSSTVVGYNVYSSTTSGGTYSKLTASPITTTTFTDSSVQAGMTYYYAVTSINSSNMESTYSNIVSGLIP